MTAHWKTSTAALFAGLAFAAAPASAAGDDAKAAFKAMSDFLAAQQAISVNYDATLEIVTGELEKIGLASSGTLDANRPDKVRVTRTGGLADVELVYDGKELSAYGKTLNVYARIPAKGPVDDVIDMLRVQYGLELPAADLLSSDPNAIMMSNVTDAKVLGDGVIRGQACEHLAFRTADVDWQIWLAKGGKPFPCRFTITSKMTVFAPSYSIEFSGWKSGADVAADDFRLKPAADAKEVSISDLKDLDEVPEPAAQGGAQ